MPKTVDIEGVGLVDFPDEMSETDISSAIDNEITAPRTPEGEVIGRGDQPIRQLGIRESILQSRAGRAIFGPPAIEREGRWLGPLPRPRRFRSSRRNWG